jgi:regulator of sigma E protease
MTTLISFVIVLGILIFIHELGHFAVAKLSGVRVERFSLGFGPRLIGFKRGETDYRISVLPLGGYVKMLGESPGEDVSDAERLRSFTCKPVLTRAAIVAAGPAMNIALAAFLLPVIFMIGIRIPAYLDGPAVAGHVAAGGAAEKAGIANGDIIESIDGKPVPTWEELIEVLSLNPGRPLDVALRRGDARLTVALTPDTSDDTGAGYAGMYPPMPPVVGGVADGYPASEAGLRPGDEIVSVDGTDVAHWAGLETLIRRDGAIKTFVVRRGDATLTMMITPRFNEEMKVFVIGINRDEKQVLKRYGLLEAVEEGLEAAAGMTWRLLVVIKGLITGRFSLKTLGGPIMIAQVAGRAAESGVSELLSLVAFLSLQLGIINLFPIPVLDGGHLLFFGIESIKGSPLSERFVAVAQQIGIALIVALMVLVTYNDIFRLFG